MEKEIEEIIQQVEDGKIGTDHAVYLVMELIKPSVKSEK